MLRLLSLLLALSCFAAATAAPPNPSRHLIIISMDGLMPEAYLEPERHELEIPNLRSLMARGVYSDGLTPVYPTVTYPVHASIATGAPPASHGIYANVYFDEGQKRANISGSAYQISPFWRQKEVEALVVASVFWPVTAGEPIDYLIPEAWWGDDKGNDPVRLAKQTAISTPGLIDSLREYIGVPLERYFESDTVKTDAAIYLLKAFRPDLLLLHYSHLDYHQHVYGIFSPEFKATLKMQDTQVGRVIVATQELGIFEQTVIMIVSDHGHAPIHSQINPGVKLVEAGLIQLDEEGNPVSWRAMILPTGGSCSIVLRDREDGDARRKVVAIAERLAADTSNGIAMVFHRSQIDSLAANTEAVVMLEAQHGFTFGGNLQGEVRRSAKSKATHGYLPGKAAMKAAFIAAGPGIANRGRIEGGSILDIYGSIGRVLSAKLENRDGGILPIFDE